MTPSAGDVWTPWYPARNRIGIPIEWMRRRILVDSIDNYAKVGLPVDEFLARPLLRRGIVLVRGRDLQNGGKARKLYVEATPDFYLPSQRLGVVALDGTLLGWAGRAYRQSKLECERLAEKAVYWRDKLLSTDLRVGIFRSEPWTD